MKLLNRNAAISALEKAKMPGKSAAQRFYNAGLNRAIQELLLIMPENEWRPVKYYGDEPSLETEMPEDEQDILVSVKYTGRVKSKPKRYVAQDICYIEKYKSFDGENYVEYSLDNCNVRNWGEVEAWMPLPEPYTEDEE